MRDNYGLTVLMSNDLRPWLNFDPREALHVMHVFRDKGLPKYAEILCYFYCTDFIAAFFLSLQNSYQS